MAMLAGEEEGEGVMDHVIVPCESAICYEMKQEAAARSRSPSRVSLRLCEERESFVNATVSRAKKSIFFREVLGDAGAHT